MPIMRGMDINSMKKYPYLIPIYTCILWGFGTGTFILLKTALTSPDITWSSKKNPEPWQKYANKKYKKLFDPAGAKGYKVMPRLKSIWD